ncbi:MAG TPA: hypothetical protein VFE65_10540 [Pseudonocardia sp.]|nr:hypothetical protein [Pseudonocardia sp.]
MPSADGRGRGTRLPTGPGGQVVIGLFVLVILVWTGDAALSYKPTTTILVAIGAGLAALVAIVGVLFAKARNER